MKLSDVIRRRWQGKEEDAYTQEQRDLISFALLYRYPAPLIGAVRAAPWKYGYSGRPENQDEIHQWIKDELAKNERLIAVALLILSGDPKPPASEAELLGSYAFSYDAASLQFLEIERMLKAHLGTGMQHSDLPTMLENALRCFPEHHDAILVSYNLALEQKREAERNASEPRRGRQPKPLVH